MVSSSIDSIHLFNKEFLWLTLPPLLTPPIYHQAVETLRELLAFWLMVSRDAPDRGMGHRFVRDAVKVLGTAEAKYGYGNEEREYLVGVTGSGLISYRGFCCLCEASLGFTMTTTSPTLAPGSASPQDTSAEVEVIEVHLPAPVTV